jgi:DNA-binding NarL/FixJ family response regulator
VSTRIRVLLVDDHALVRQALAERLAREPDIEIIGLFETADHLAMEAVQLKPDVVVLDIDMPGVGCFEAARDLRESCPDAGVLFLSAFCHDTYVAQALAVGARGYLTKGEPPQALIDAVRAVAAGLTRYSPDVQKRIVVDEAGACLGQGVLSRFATLTPRELDVLRYIARGQSQKDIAATMHLSARTVHCHCANLMRKLNVHDRVELARFAIREGLVEA